jgi:hypothetical protein
MYSRWCSLAFHIHDDHQTKWVREWPAVALLREGAAQLQRVAWMYSALTRVPRVGVARAEINETRMGAEPRRVRPAAPRLTVFMLAAA